MPYLRLKENLAGCEYGEAYQHEIGTYDVDDATAAQWLASGVAEIVDPSTVEQELPPQDESLPRPLLTINICSIRTRHKFLTRLLKVLMPQITGEVQLNIDIDNGDITIGQKRQRMLLSSYGHYICWVDDDDLVSPHYVEKILKAIEDGPDCVGFFQDRYKDGQKIGVGEYSLRHKEWNTRLLPGGMVVCERGPCHLTPVHRDIATVVRFEPKNSGEDLAYSQAIHHLCHRENIILDTLYTYELRSEEKRAGEVVNV